jgi:glycosyltransferase involved in cell wall biosynthesis
VPSVCNEAWGAVVTEAQLRGIPVIASNAGGIPEAKIDLPYVIPVNAVTGEVDPKTGDYIVPEQDMAPWVDAVASLMAQDTSEYEELSDYTARKTVQWIRSLDPRAQEKWLLSM